MPEFVTRPLGDICDEGDGFIRTGPFGSQLHQSDYTKVGTPVVMPKDIIEDKVDESEIARISDEDLERLSQHRLDVGDIVYGRRGDIGRHALIPTGEQGWLCGTGCLRIHLGKKSPLIPAFLHYYLKKPEVIEWIYNQAIGATMPNLNTSILRSVVIQYPPIFVQQKIASILSVYDDLIHNNLCRIKILEEMAQNLYREWFVKFRFPGHQKYPPPLGEGEGEGPYRLVDSPLGKIPEGWEVCALSDLIDFVKGVEPGSKNYQGNRGNEMVPFLRVGDLGKRDSTIFVKCELVKDSVLRPEDIAVTMDGTVGIVRIGFEGGYSSGIRRVVIREPKRIGWAFVYQLLQSDSIQGIIHSHAKGTTIKHASSSIDYMVFALPKTTLLEGFEKHAAPMLKQTLSLARRNEVLRRTRDLLLPKLISGELDVSELDIIIPEANA